MKKWTFKGMDGVKHVAAFLTSSEPQVIQAHPASSQVIMNNCIRCHEQLNTELVKTGRIDYMMSEVGKGKACWDCHRDVPHGGKNSLSSTPAAIVPLPDSPVLEWLRKVKELFKTRIVLFIILNLGRDGCCLVHQWPSCFV